ncbi:uncharacterized protein CTRU02_210087 [Colletotrichum truncatum]|uniref:Uncharacterized protein n=1 Tax=Colletotrichum truncatum TaxID=5467 RepID=A0ACC3YVL2_COLTU|nr:uncharacterized protein CTRU02_02663 [Colletotrichum truncatum]KAF6798689.1 hypothetical protein CTRU02_02663 [Colletotrichum truncatum]
MPNMSKSICLEKRHANPLRHSFFEASLLLSMQQ